MDIFKLYQNMFKILMVQYSMRNTITKFVFDADFFFSICILMTRVFPLNHFNARINDYFIKTKLEFLINGRLKILFELDFI